jgi:glycosyltransferase involved in cell wall biosynthesis
MPNSPLEFYVLTPTFNRCARLVRNLQALQNQSEHVRWTSFIADDGSSDQTSGCIKDLAACDKRIRYFDLETNRGANHARNFLLERILEQSKPGVVAFLDDDDRYLADVLPRVASSIDAMPDASWFVGRAVDSAGHGLTTLKGQDPFCYIRDHKLGRRMKGPVAHFIRTSAIGSARYSTEFANSEEWIFFADIARREKVHPLQIDVMEVEYLPDGLTSRQLNRDLEEKILRAKLEHFDWAMTPRMRSKLLAKLGRAVLARGDTAAGLSLIKRALTANPLEWRAYRYLFNQRTN